MKRRVRGGQLRVEYPGQFREDSPPSLRPASLQERPLDVSFQIVYRSIRNISVILSFYHYI